MKFECPNCKKVMMIKDAFAGKTGKCPGCGQKVTLPEIDANGPADDIGPESEAIMAAESEAFIGETGAAGKTKTKRTPTVIAVAVAVFAIACVAVIFYLQSPARIRLPGLSLHNVASDEYVRRSQALPTTAILAWQNAVKKATGEYLTSKQIFFVLPNLDGLWRNGAFDPAALNTYLARMPDLPLHALRDFRTALQRVAGDDVGASLSNTLLRLVEIDRLFDGNRFDSAASDRLIARLNLLLSDDVTRWANVLEAGTGQAALSLICMDPFFKNNRFEKKRFEKKLRSLR